MNIVYLDIAQLVLSINQIIENQGYIDEFNILARDFEVGKSKKINALYGIYSCLLGKKVTPDNGAEWGRKCCKALLGTVGGDMIGHPIESVFPTVIFANDYYSRISITKDLRTIAYWFLKVASTNLEASAWQKDLCNSILLRLSWSDLTGFKLIYTFLLSTNRFLWLWGWLACNCYTLIKAVSRFIGFKEEGPYLKLLCSNNENPEFNNYIIRRMAEVARLVGIIDGQTTLARVKTGFQFENQEIVVESLRDIIAAGDKGLYAWVLFARNHILPVKENKEFYRIISNTNLLNPSISNDTNAESTSGEGRVAGVEA